MPKNHVEQLTAVPVVRRRLLCALHNTGSELGAAAIAVSRGYKAREGGAAIAIIAGAGGDRAVGGSLGHKIRQKVYGKAGLHGGYMGSIWDQSSWGEENLKDGRVG